MFCGKQAKNESNHIIRKSGNRGRLVWEAEPEGDRRENPQKPSLCFRGIETKPHEDKRDPSPRKRLLVRHGVQEVKAVRRRLLSEEMRQLPECGLPDSLPSI